MQVKINRYSLLKEYITTGILEIIYEGQWTHLTYIDSVIEVQASELYFPIKALESLRKILETEHKSLIGLVGCRIDTAYRGNGWGGTYFITKGTPASGNTGIFYPTEDVDKLCTVDEHKAAYLEWVNSLFNQ